MTRTLWNRYNLLFAAFLSLTVSSTVLAYLLQTLSGVGYLGYLPKTTLESIFFAGISLFSVSMRTHQL